MIKNMKDSSFDAILRLADSMVTAAITAPKASGQDKIVALSITGPHKEELSLAMERVGERFCEEFIKRDAKNVRESQCVVIIGVKNIPFGLNNCERCGFKNCAENAKNNGTCAINVTDLGIAIGSAISLAADNRVDNRVMYSVGRGALEMGCMPEDVRLCYGIPLYAGSKSIYFDRGPGAVLF